MTDSKKRDTRQRRMVLDAVMNRCDHPSADEIYMDIHAKDPKVSKGTVYRNLKLLADNGDITRVVVRGADRYDYRPDTHYHLICTECGLVTDAPLIYLNVYDEAVSEKTGFRISRHRTVFEGICSECQRKKQDNC